LQVLVCANGGIDDPMAAGANTPQLSCAAMQTGFRELNMLPPILFCGDDWRVLVVDAGLCSEDGSLSRADFARLIITEFHRYVLDEVTESSVRSVDGDDWTPERVRTVMLALKARLLMVSMRGRDLERQCSDVDLTSVGGVDDSSARVVALEVKLSQAVSNLHRRFYRVTPPPPSLLSSPYPSTYRIARRP